MLDAHNAVQSASGSVGRLQDEVSGLQSRGMALLDDFDTIRGHARSAVSNAAGIAPSQGWFSGMMHSIGNFVDGVAKGIGKSVWDLVSGKAIINFVEHPSWKTFGELAKDVAVTASLVAMVAAPFAAPELAEADAVAVGADAAVDGAADAAAEGAAGGRRRRGDGRAGDGASTFAKGARVVSDNANRVVTAGGLASSVSDAEQGKWGEAAVDLAFTAGPNLGHMPTGLDDVQTFGDQFSNALGVGERQADAAKEGLEGLQDFKSWQDVGLNPVAAKQISFADGEFPAAAKSFDLSSQSGLQDAISNAKATAAKTAAGAPSTSAVRWPSASITSSGIPRARRSSTRSAPNPPADEPQPTPDLLEPESRPRPRGRWLGAASELAGAPRGQGPARVPDAPAADDGAHRHRHARRQLPGRTGERRAGGARDRPGRDGGRTDPHRRAARDQARHPAGDPRDDDGGVLGHRRAAGRRRPSRADADDDVRPPRGREALRPRDADQPAADACCRPAPTELSPLLTIQYLIQSRYGAVAYAYATTVPGMIFGEGGRGLFRMITEGGYIGERPQTY